MKIITLFSTILLITNTMGQGLFVADQPVDELPNHRILPRPPRPIDRFLPIQIQKSEITTNIKGQFATTTITQTLYNPANCQVQGFFLFPLPHDARIDSFSMEIDGELSEGELLDAARARKIYEDIVRKSLDPALFEYSEQSLFKIRIFPFESCSTKQIRLRYTQLLPKDENLIHYTLPLKSREHCQASDQKSDGKFTLKVTIEIPGEQRFKTIYSPSHDIKVAYEPNKTGAAITLSDSKESPTTDFQLIYSTGPADETATPLSTEFLTHYHKDSNAEGHFLLLVSPQIWNEREVKAQPKDVVFVLDSSGSMRDGKLEKALEGLDFCLDSLNPEDRFQIVRFSTESESLFKGLVEASDANRKRADEFVATIKAIGGTAVEDALSAAVRNLAATSNPDNHPRQIIFITDGKPTLGATNEKVLVDGVQRQLKEAGVKARIFSFGIGTEINTHLLDLLARETRASSQYALPTEDIEHKISRFYSRFAAPVFSDLSVEIEGTEWLRSVAPKDLPDVFRGDQLIVLGRFKKAQDQGELKLKGTFQGKIKTFTFPISLAKGLQQNPFIPRLWAVRRVGWLLEQIRLNGENDELKEEVTSLAREYAIVTPYTSWLILEDEAKRSVPLTNRSLRSIESAPAAKMNLRQKADAFAGEKTGNDAFASAASEADFKNARNISAQSQAMDRSNYMVPSDTAAILPQNRVFNGKSFFLNFDQWVDSAAQSLPSETPVRQIRFASEDYFNFIQNMPSACQWFALGNNLRLTLDNKEIIEIIN